ncbi:MAG: class I SAM-dependent methyltransferase [Planctomycetes bacterium]|nr:class I SAM-dependent methyltransferase [Planctomycetota bacterium]
MTPAAFKDHFSGHAADYRAFRPPYPPELFAFLARVAPGRELAWDCGTGSGQAAVPLAEHFSRVFATDASTEQVKNADPHPKVEYAVAPAEKCPLPDASADLVLVAQALHWFDHDRFYAEVRRVCKPGGVIAATCYYAPSVGPEVDPVLREWEDFIRPYWTPERVWVDDGYRSIPFPFPDLDAPRFEVSAPVALAGFVGYLGTWSASKRYLKQRGADPLERFAEEFAAAWGSPSAVRPLRWELAMRLARVGA